jgi:ERF superfamily
MSKAQDVIIGVMNEVRGVGKHEKNAAQGFNFRGIDAVVNAVGPAFRKHGGFLVPRIINKTTSVLPTKNGGSINAVSLEVEFAVYGSEGDPITGTVASESFDSGDKATAKAMSVALRTFLLQTLLLPTDEPDPDTFSYELGQPAVDTTKRDAVVKAVANAATADELRAIWKANAPILDVAWTNSLGEQVTLKGLIMARQSEVK